MVTHAQKGNTLVASCISEFRKIQALIRIPDNFDFNLINPPRRIDDLD